MIQYINHTREIEVKDLEGFFVGWPKPPSQAKHLDILNNSTYRWLAIDDTTGNVVGFITAISDQVLSAYIPLLEVLPEYHGKGIGTHLVERMLETLDEFYMVDIMCDESVQTFYERFKCSEGEGGDLKIKMFPARGRITRNYKGQSGVEERQG